ncbi:DUF6652 family protein [Abyssisolibacter fermentans]|uniref:DUF6652 family protein n=1 Tax=Abyssisolibacter fermentans TaxID=1766203 RepID=UPI0008302B93|nr:DUF6652 family protein [Abyssisolibacter fermentans]
MKLIRNTLLWLYVNLFMVILLIVSLLSALIKGNMGNWIQWLLIIVITISNILNMIFAVKNIINTCRFYKNREYNSLRKHMKTLKLGIIPYFILNFIIYFLIFMIFFTASRGIIIFSPIPLLFLIPIFFTYLIVLFTSCYGIGFVLILGREKKIKRGMQIIHFLLQMCFVLDVIDTIILLIKYKVEGETYKN